MGTIIDKLRYLAETKYILRLALMSVGIDVPNSATFRDYADLIKQISTGVNSADDRIYAIVAEDGTTYTAVEVESRVIFTAKPEDLREGAIAASTDGIIVGTLSNEEISSGDKLVQLIDRSITEVDISLGTTDIGPYAFAWCTKLTSVNMPNSVTRVYKYAFHKCVSLTDVQLPYGVVHLAEHAFSECSNLQSINFPDTMHAIGPYCFQYCSALTDAQLPANLQSIEDGAFYACTGLTSIVIPATCQTIGRYAFYDCSSLTEITFLGTPGKQGILGDAFSMCTNLRTINVPWAKDDANAPTWAPWGATNATVNYGYTPNGA